MAARKKGAKKSAAKKKSKPKGKGATQLGSVKTKKASFKPKKPESKARTKKEKGQLPLPVLEARAAWMVAQVEKRGGKVQPHKGIITHRTPKMVGKSRQGKKRRSKRGKKK